MSRKTESAFKVFDPAARGVLILEAFKDIIYNRDESLSSGMYLAANELGFGDDVAGVREAVYLLTGERHSL